MWNTFNTYDLSPEDAFETMNNQLFERYLSTQYSDKLVNFRVINGSGGDGGIEAYGLMNDNSIIAVQSKWFRNNLDDSQINQIKKSVQTAVGLRPAIKKYIICIPRNINSLKIGKVKMPIKNSEESRINALLKDLTKEHPQLDIIWWFEHELKSEILKQENEGIHKYWFEREIFFFKTLAERFRMQKTNSWLKERYVPNLNSSGLIQSQISKQTFSEPFRKHIFKISTKLYNEIIEFKSLLDPLIQHSADRSYYADLKKVAVTIEIVKCYLDEIKLIASNAIEVILDLSMYDQAIYDTIEDLKKSLKNSMPSNLQKPNYEKIVLQLDILQSEILYGFEKLCNTMIQIPCCIIYGRAGTGKTHGLAFGVDEYLRTGSPAILIRAYGASSKSWESLLGSELGLPQWNLNEILSALETLAHRNDIKNSKQLEIGAEPNFESCKVLICIDGLEEDNANWDNWYDRISEVEEMAKRFPRLRILFSARDYFYSNSKIPNSRFLSEITLPREGDVGVLHVLEDYLKEYRISIANVDIIKGLDSLFALRLFCEEYRGRTVTDDGSFETATGILLNLKLKRLNEEFLRMIGKQALDVNPVTESLLLISEMFYSCPELSHKFIKAGVANDLLQYLENPEIEQLLQFLSENGIMTRFERETKKSLIKNYEKYYSITYQSILEIVLSESITSSIIDMGLQEFPDIVFQNFALPADINPIEFRRKYNKTPDQQLIQNVVNSIFLRTGRLVGFDGFLAKGFNEKEIFEMQLEALSVAPYDLAKTHEAWINEMLETDYHKRFTIIKTLIYPLANRIDTPFNALFLHNILNKFPDAFSRDKFWSGLDNYEKSIRNFKSVWNLGSVLNSYRNLNSYDRHDGQVLIYAWGLSTLDQRLRENLRTKITKWALLVPHQFLELLDMLFYCNDPQIQEDLASIILGISSRCKDKGIILELAKWSLGNVFDKKQIYRNVVIRYGFNAIVERAFQLKLVGKDDLNKSRPSHEEEFTFLPLEISYFNNPKEEFYPIVHDLAWYVIKDAYDKFLTYEVGYNKDGMTKETDAFIKKYELEHKSKYTIGCRDWAMAAALNYIKSLGFNRTNGSGHTEATHGSKSEKFTYEEKYTWLAVNFLKGYLSDYLPYNDYDEKFWIKDYSVITDIHNPADDFDNDFENKVDIIFNPLKWLIGGVLAPEIQKDADLHKSIENLVNDEPEINFEDWINYDCLDFGFLGVSKSGVALYNYTGLYNSSKTIHSSIEIHCCLIRKSDFTDFKAHILNNFNNKILRDDLQFYATPKTDIYTNPSDIVWMDWISEEGVKRYFSSNITFNVSLSKIVKRNVEGEQEIYLPSKQVRKILGITALEGSNYIDQNNSIVGISHKVKTDVFGESQEVLIIDDLILKSNLNKKGLIRFWFALTIINKNNTNENIDSIPFYQKVRKYLVWEEEGSLKSFKFWDGKFSNE